MCTGIQIYKLNFEEELKWSVYVDPESDVLHFLDTGALDIFAQT